MAYTKLSIGFVLLHVDTEGATTADYVYASDSPVMLRDPFGSTPTAGPPPASLAELEQARSIMQGMCSCPDCLPGYGNQAISDCQKEASKIIDDIKDVWGSYDPSKDHTGTEQAGGKFCWDWASEWEKRLSQSSWTYWAHQKYEAYDPTSGDDNGNFEKHQAERLAIRQSPHNPKCIEWIDDGFINHHWHHEVPPKHKQWRINFGGVDY